MKTNKIALASLLAAIGGFAALATPASASPEFAVKVGFAAPAVCPPAPVVVERYHRPEGYWKEISVKVWVPASWTTSCDRFGRTVKVYHPGYYTYRPDRVWVVTRR